MPRHPPGMGINEVDGTFTDEELRPLIYHHTKPLHVEDSHIARILYPWRSSQLGIAGVDEDDDLVFIPWAEVKIVWQEGKKEGGN